MSINHLINENNETKLNVYCNTVNSELGFVDKANWCAQFSELDSINKDLLTGWQNLTIGTGRTQLGKTSPAVRNSLLNPQTECYIVDISGEFATDVVGAVGPWQFSVPTFFNATLGVQEFVLSECIAIDSALNEYRALPITFPGIDDYNAFAWTNLGALAGQTITVKYRYTLSQEVPFVV
jgi:hypothetical protein